MDNKIRFKDCEFKRNVFLAPLAGISDISTRRICEIKGCELTYTEMISAKALYHSSKKTEDMLRVPDEEKFVGVQIFGNDPIIMASICEEFNENNKIILVDINMGCPAPKIVKNGEGAYLMSDEDLSIKIVKEIRKVLKKPLTVKIRSGMNKNNINAVKFAKKLEDCGIDGITVHGRTADQMYSGVSDLNIIRNVKSEVKIPVIGNGDVTSYDSYKNMIEKTSCDGVMIGRGALGNPWIFEEINSGIMGHEYSTPTYKERVDVCIEHYLLSLKYYDESKVVREMRKQIGWYLKGLPNSIEVKNYINAELSHVKVLEKLNNYKNELSKTENYLNILE